MSIPTNNKIPRTFYHSSRVTKIPNEKKTYDQTPIFFQKHLAGTKPQEKSIETK